MDQIISANAHDLLTCFFDECENRFRFLEEKHGYLCFSGMAEYKNNYKIIRPYKQNALQEGQPFFATTRYEKHNRTVEILYGDKNLVLEAYIYPDAQTRLSLRDIIMAARSSVTKPASLSYLSEPQNISEAVEWFSTLLQKHPKILEPSAKLVDRAITISSKLTEESIRAHFTDMIKEASVFAAKAFLEKNYNYVIALLTPFEGYLTISDLKKLKIARAKLS